jgi:hypothetical protein
MLFQFVDKPSTAPVVYLVLEGGDLSLQRDSFSMGAPEYGGSPMSIGANDGYRTLTFKLKSENGYARAAVAFSAVSVQLLKPRGWLMLQWDNNRKPVFLRYYRTQTTPLDFGDAGLGYFEAPINLTIDPYLYGELVTVGPVTVTNNPAGSAGTNPCFYKFAAPLGDAPAPLTLKVTSSSTAVRDPVFVTNALDPSQSPTTPTVVQAGSLTQGTDTTSGADAGGSNGFISTTTFATNNTLTPSRLSGTVAPIPGTYRVFLRAAAGTAAADFSIQMFGGIAFGLTPTFDYSGTINTTSYYWVDLGLRTFPFGVADPDYTDIAAAGGTETIDIRAKRNSGSGNLKLDCLLLVPIDTAATIETHLLWAQNLTLSATQYAQFDGFRDRYALRNTSDQFVSQPQTPIIGDWLWIRPGYTNTLHLVGDVIGVPFITTPGADVLTDTHAVTATYYPRYLHLRPDGT